MMEPRTQQKPNERIQNSRFKSQNEINKVKKYKKDLKDMSHSLALQAIDLIDSLPKNMSCQVIGRQLLRSSMSVGANISEARSSGSRKDFVNFLTYSLKSANESIFCIGLLSDSGKVSHSSLQVFRAGFDEIARILAASIIKLKQKDSD